MVIETFKDGDASSVYQRLSEKGRGIPDGVRYVDSWVDIDRSRCFQLMECNDPAELEPWIAFWSDLVEFEVIPVTSSAAASKSVMEADTASALPDVS